MKKNVFLFVLFISLVVSQNIEARKGFIVYHDGPKFTITEKLPQDCTVEDQHVNLGVAYEQFGLFWLPLWNYGETKYALVSDDEEKAWELTGKGLAELEAKYSLDIPETPSIPFWEKVGLKPVVAILLLLIIWGYLPGRRRNA